MYGQVDFLSNARFLMRQKGVPEVLVKGIVRDPGKLIAPPNEHGTAVSEDNVGNQRVRVVYKEEPVSGETGSPKNALVISTMVLDGTTPGRSPGTPTLP
jgi:hypothetical protein